MDEQGITILQAASSISCFLASKYMSVDEIDALFLVMEQNFVDKDMGKELKEMILKGKEKENA